MLTLILLATCVPVLVGSAYLAMRNKCPQLLADARGIALQTVIVIVVLLAIGGAVAGVLLSRGDQAVADLQRQDIDVPDDAASVPNPSPSECARWGYKFNPDPAGDGSDPAVCED